MSIRARLGDNPPEGDAPARPKIRSTLMPPPEPIPERILRFWHAEERIPPPWRYIESPAEQSARELLEDNGCWAGL